MKFGQQFSMKQKMENEIMWTQKWSCQAFRTPLLF